MAEPQADRQLPLGTEIFLDHVGHFVRDPHAASRALARAGFAPTPLSVQTQPDPAGGAPRLTGTGNVTAMLGRGYVEVLFRTADTPLGQELDTAMARYPGIHLVAFAVADAARAHQRLRENGFRMRSLVDMQRPVDTEPERDCAADLSPPPWGEGSGVGVVRGGTAEQNGTTSPPPQGGREYTVAPPQPNLPPIGIAAFTVARLEPGEMPEGRIQLLTHRTEDMVWQPRWLSHPNGALGLTGVMIAVSDVSEAAERFGRLTGRVARASALGQTIGLDRGRVDLVTAATFSDMLPQVPIPSLPFIGAYGISVGSIEIVEGALKRGGLVAHRVGSCLVAAFPEELGCGAWLFSGPNQASADPR